jgi:branched-chain amino acid transport system substrate-binding protein
LPFAGRECKDLTAIKSPRRSPIAKKEAMPINHGFFGTKKKGGKEMRKGRMGVWMAFLCALVMFPSSSAMAAETIRIGSLFPYTGPLALLGQETFNGATIAEDMVNEKGGIGGKKIEWVKADGVDPKKAMTECERLIAVEKVKVIFGTYSSSLSYAASEVAERNKVVYFEQGAIADPITARGFKYLFRFCAKAGEFGILAANFAHGVVAPKLKIDPKKMKVAIMFEDSLYGTTVGNNAVKRAKELGMDVVASESYSHKTVDLSPVVMIFKSKNPDVIIATSYIEDGILFWRQAKDMDLNVKAFIGTGACHGMPEFAKTFGKEANYVFNIDPAVGINPKIYKGNTEAILKDFQQRFNKKFGHHPATHATAGFDGARLLFEYILPKAPSLDPEAVRNAALAVDIPQGAASMFGYGVKFNPPDHPDAGQNLRAHPVLMQWQDERLWVVYPPEFSIKKLLLPLPTWEERAKGTIRFVD